ncbi:MAG: hypothetical protein HQ567_07985 [Candidatus Nealsonbacteria bacterium]|nr:hypothetical protein [Candidatus Nealsonbacteria bacterium]
MTSEQAPNDPSETIPRLQFSLRTLMGLTAAVALLFGMWSWRGELGVLYYFQGVAVCVVAMGAVQRRIRLVLIGLLVLAGIHVGLSYSIRHSSIHASWSWHAMTVPVKVVDANTGRPVVNAAILPEIGFRADATTTDAMGYAELDANLPMLNEQCETIVGPQCTRWISFENISTRVEAEGYRPARVRLQQHYGARHDLPGDPLPPITVKLQRAVSAAKAVDSG